MKNKFRKIINSILASSFTALAGSFDTNLQSIDYHTQSNIEINIEDKKKIQKSLPTLVLKPQYGRMLLAGHKSHSSHSSHRSGNTGNVRNGHNSHTSHSSHRSALINDTNTRNRTPQKLSNPPGARVVTPNTLLPKTQNHHTQSTPNLYVNPSTQSAPNTNVNSSVITNNVSKFLIDDKDYTLGMRELSLGMKGSDVIELTTLLRKYGFLDELNEEYNFIVQKAVSDFQQEAKLDGTGICNFTTIKTLKNWENNELYKEKIKNDNNVQEGQVNIISDKLQSAPKKELKNNRRSLKISDYGNDVNELIKILIKEKKLSILYKDRILFDKNVEHALKKLQKELGVPATGIYDDKTYDSLMNKETN